MRKMLTKLRLATGIVILFAFLGVNAQTWENVGLADVISAGNSSWNNLAVDNNGNYYVSYYDLSVTQGSVQKFDGISWAYLGGSAGITGGSATYSSLSLDGLGNVYYTNQFSDFSSWPFLYEMQVRQFNGTSWTQTASAFSGGDGVNYQASAVSSSNTLYAYAGPGGGTVKRFVSGVWEQVGTANIAGAAPTHAEIVIGSDDTVYVLHNASGVKVYSNSANASDTDAWTLVGGENVGTTFIEGGNATLDMAIDGSNNVYVVFSSNAANNRRLNVKKFNGTSWEQLGDANFGISNDLYNVAIAVTPSGKPYVVASGWAINDGKNTVYTLNEDTNTWETFGGDFISDAAATYNDLVYDAVNGYLVLTYTQSGIRIKRISLEESPAGNGITGYNYDIIANGIGDALDSSDLGMDEQNQRALVSLDFQATESSPFPTYGLPVDGIINSVNTPGITYQLADYSEPNALYLTPSYVTGSVNDQDTGTLSFTAENVEKVYILTTGCGFGDDFASLPYTAIVNFSDGTSQTETLQLRDWYDKPDFAIQGIGRVNRANNNLEGDSSNPRLYEEFITLDTENQSKTITGVTFSFDGESTAPWANEIRMAVLSITTTEVSSVSVTAIEVTTENDVDTEITTIGGTLQLIATITPENATNQEVIWSVESGSDFASVDENGLVTAIANGTATVRATSDEDSIVFDEIEVTVNYTEPVILVESIEVTTEDDVEAEITTIGGTLQLIATITPENATNQEVIWSVESGSEFASVDENGLVTALAEGIATVRAASDEDNTIFDEIEVVISTLSIMNISADTIRIYPNPTNGILNIETQSEVVLVEVYNLIGQKTISYKNASKIDFSSLQDGVYIAKIQTSTGETVIRKITKKYF